MIASLLTPEALLALLTLTAMEIVLGIDNIIFIAILVGRLPKGQQARARSIGIIAALVMRIGLLFSINWIMRLQDPLFAVMQHGVSGRDLILLAGGLFLIGKSTLEIHHKVEGVYEQTTSDIASKPASAAHIIAQVMVLDIVFSLDSVITAVGMVKDLAVMVIAMVIAMVVMLLSAGSISAIVEKHPTLKILALSFLILIGVMLVFEGMGGHMSKGYIYFAMFFSLSVEMLNMRYRSRSKPR